MLDQLPRKGRQFGAAPHADGQIAHRPRIGQRDGGDRHRLRHPSRGGFRHDADADIAFHQPAYRVEAEQLHAQTQRPAGACSLGGEEALQRAGASETDEVVIEDILEPDLGALGQRVIARDNKDETVAPKRISLQRAGIDGARDNADVGDAFGNQPDDLVA
jgi:hypothetical protein